MVASNCRTRFIPLFFLRREVFIKVCVFFYSSFINENNYASQLTFPHIFIFTWYSLGCLEVHRFLSNTRDYSLTPTPSLSLGWNGIRMLTRGLSCHCGLNKHMPKLQLKENRVCTFCLEVDKSPLHLLTQAAPWRAHNTQY